MENQFLTNLLAQPEFFLLYWGAVSCCPVPPDKLGWVVALGRGPSKTPMADSGGCPHTPELGAIIAEEFPLVSSALNPDLNMEAQSSRIFREPVPCWDMGVLDVGPEPTPSGYTPESPQASQLILDILEGYGTFSCCLSLLLGKVGLLTVPPFNVSGSMNNTAPVYAQSLPGERHFLYASHSLFGFGHCPKVIKCWGSSCCVWKESERSPSSLQRKQGLRT